MPPGTQPASSDDSADLMNRETRVIAEWLMLDRCWRERWLDLVEACTHADGRRSPGELGEKLQAIVQSYVPRGIRIYTDLVTAALARVRWEEVARQRLADADFSSLGPRE